MLDTMTRITIGGTEYPIRCDILVLEKLQDYFGSLDEFETRTEFKIETVREEKRLIKEPDIGAVLYSLFEMVLEGLDMEGKDPIGYKAFMRSCDVNPVALASIVRMEYSRCFTSKKNDSK